MCGCHRDRSPGTLSTGYACRRAHETAVRRMGVPRPDHPEGAPRLGPGHDPRSRRRTRPDLDAQPPAHLPRDRRARRQGSDHTDRPGRRTRSRPRHPRPDPGRPTLGQAVARHPVEHLRDVRTELLVKLHLRRRAGLDDQALLAVQRQLFEPAIDTLTSTHADDDLVDLWRRESARAVRRFLDQALHPVERPAATMPELRLSARNQLPRHPDRGASR